MARVNEAIKAQTELANEDAHVANRMNLAIVGAWGEKGQDEGDTLQVVNQNPPPLDPSADASVLAGGGGGQETLLAQAVSPGTPESTSWTGRPPQRQADLTFRFFDERTGQTVTVTQPLWKDDNWNLGGYFTVDRNGGRHDISAWSPAAASGENARAVVLDLLNEGLIDPRNVTIAQTHQQMFGGDGGVYWIPTARQTYQDGVALFHAQRAAQMNPTSSVTLQPNDNPEFARGYRDAELGDRVMSGYALFQTSLAIAGTVVAPINTARIQGRGNFEIVNPNTGQRLRVSSDPRTGGVRGTLYDRNGVPLASQTTVGRDFNRTVTATPNGSNVTPNVNPGALTRVTPQTTVAPGVVVTERPLTVAGTPITIRSETGGGAPNFTAIYGGRQVPLLGATSFEQASQQVTSLASQGRLPGVEASGPVVTDSPLSLSSGGRNYQFTIRNTQENGQSAYTLHYRIGGQDRAFRLDGARTLDEASRQVTNAFNNGALPGIVSGGPTVTDSPLTLSRGGQSFDVTVRNIQDNGQSLYTVRYRIGGQDHEYSLPGAGNLSEASRQVTDALNNGALPGISSYTQSPLTLTADGKSYRVTIHNVQIGGQPNYTVSYRIGGEDHAFTLPGARNLSEASRQVTDAFNAGNLPGLTRPQPQETPAVQETPQPSTVGAMSAGDTPQPSLTPDEIASASDLTQRFPTLNEARAYAETRPETEIFKYTDRPGSPEGDDTVYFRGGQVAAPTQEAPIVQQRPVETNTGQPITFADPLTGTVYGFDPNTNRFTLADGTPIDPLANAQFSIGDFSINPNLAPVQPGDLSLFDPNVTLGIQQSQLQPNLYNLAIPNTVWGGVNSPFGGGYIVVPRTVYAPQNGRQSTNPVGQPTPLLGFLQTPSAVTNVGPLRLTISGAGTIGAQGDTAGFTGSATLPALGGRFGVWGSFLNNQTTIGNVVQGTRLQGTRPTGTYSIGVGLLYSGNARDAVASAVTLFNPAAGQAISQSFPQGGSLVLGTTWNGVAQVVDGKLVALTVNNVPLPLDQLGLRNFDVTALGNLQTAIGDAAFQARDLMNPLFPAPTPPSAVEVPNIGIDRPAEIRPVEPGADITQFNSVWDYLDHLNQRNPGGSVGAMSANDRPQPSVTPEEVARAIDLTQRFPTLEEARAYAETRPETEIFSYVDEPGSAEGDYAIYFRGGQEARSGQPPVPTPPEPLGNQELSTIAQQIGSLPPEQRAQVGSPLLGILSGQDVSALSPLLVVPGGSIPNVYHNVHTHDLAFSGTYDPTYPGADMSRAVEISVQGSKAQFVFPVSPHIFSMPTTNDPGAAGLIPGAPAYYLARQIGPNGEAQLIMGKVTLQGDMVRVEGYGITDVNGNLRIRPDTYTRQQFEALLQTRIPENVTEISFVSTPRDVALGYMGPRVDQNSISLVGTRMASEFAATPGFSPTQQSQFIGLVGANPYDPAGYRTFYNAFNYANRLEGELGLPPGSIPIAGAGEITLAKESVSSLTNMPSLANADQATLNAVSQFLAPMRYSGGITIIHADAGSPRTMPGLSYGLPNVNTMQAESDMSNIDNLITLFQQNPDQQFIWAHSGASLTSTMPDNYLQQVERVLQSAPNVKIDLSWSVTNRWIQGNERIGLPSNYVNPERVNAWADLVARYPDRFLWGSDNIAASRNRTEDVAHGVLRELQQNGFLQAIEVAGIRNGNPGALDQFLNSNFNETIRAAEQRVSQWRSDPEVAAWLANGGPSEANGLVPPKQWIQNADGSWSLVRTADLGPAGNRDTMIMPDSAQPIFGPRIIWTIDPASGNAVRQSAQSNPFEMGPINPERLRYQN